MFPRHVEDDLACRFNLDEGDSLLDELDFHFAKETENGIWSHKKGKTKKTSYSDDNNEIIKNPLLAYFVIDEENGNSVKYDFIGCYKLKKK